MRQFTFTTHQTLAGCAAARLAQIPPRPTRPTTPIPDSKSAAAAARGPSVSPPPSDVGRGEAVESIFLASARARMAAADCHLQHVVTAGGRERGGLHILFPSDRCAATRRRTKPKILRSLLSKANEWPAGGSPAHGVGEEAAASGRIFCSVSPSLLFTSISCLHKGAAQ